MQDHGIPEQHRTNPMLLELAEHLQAPLLATNDSHYVHRSDSVAHDALLCVQTGSQMSDPDRFKFHGDEHYLKPAHEMRYLFDEIPEACDNTLWIAERADVTIEFGKPQLPDLPAARRASRPTPSYLQPPHDGGRPAALGRAASTTPSSSASPTSSA